MEQWFMALTGFEKIYWSVALVASCVFLLLLVLTLLGGDTDGADTDVDTDIASDGGIHFQFLSLKNLVGFLTLFGWSGIACLEAGMSVGITLAVSLACGLAMMWIMAALFYYLGKLQDSGTLKLGKAVGQIGEVYLSVGGQRSRIGKVSIKIQGALRELEALTDEKEDLPQGRVVRVVQVTANGLLIVENSK